MVTGLPVKNKFNLFGGAIIVLICFFAVLPSLRSIAQPAAVIAGGVWFLFGLAIASFIFFPFFAFMVPDKFRTKFEAPLLILLGVLIGSVAMWIGFEGYLLYLS